MFRKREKLIQRIKAVENKVSQLTDENTIGEIRVAYFCGDDTVWLWEKFTSSNIIDDVNGYLKLKIKGRYDKVKGEERLDKSSTLSVFPPMRVFWIKKDYIVWHYKDIYAEEKKKIENKK